MAKTESGNNDEPKSDAEIESEPSETVAIPEELEEQLDERIQQIVMERYSGQFPHPEYMERYAKLYPRSPAIIFEQFENQSAHRREVEKTYMRGNEHRSNVGQWLAYSLVVLSITAGLVAVLTGQATAGSTIIISAFGGGIILYIAGGSARSQGPARTVKRNETDRFGARRGPLVRSKPEANKD